MNLHWLQQPWLETLGWALLHSLWELSAIAAIAFFAILLLRHQAAQVRYVVGYVVLLIMMALPLATYAILWTHRPATIAPVADVPTTGFRDLIIAATGDNHSAIVPGAVGVRDRALALLHSVPPYAAVVYLAGAAMLILRLFVGYTALRRLRRDAHLAGPCQALVETLRDRLGISVPVQMRHSAQVDVPTVIGAWRPLILLPLTTTTGLSTEHLTCLLLHELAHIRRHDFLANLVQSLIETLLFYHPAVTWLSGVIRQEREHCCDDIAAAAIGNRGHYAAALVSMESLRATSRNLVVAANGGSLLGRIQRLLRPAAPRSLSQRIISGSSLLAAAILVAGFACYLAACSRDDTASSSPTTSTSTAPADRVARIGDVLMITVASPDANYADHFPVDENGNVNVPEIGGVPAVGKTPQELADAIANAAVVKGLQQTSHVHVDRTNKHADLGPLQEGVPVLIKVFGLESPGRMRTEIAFVDKHGEIPVSHLGRVHVAELTPTEAAALIASTAVDKGVLRRPAYAQVLRIDRNQQISVESRVMFVDDSVLSPETLPPDGQTKTILLTEKELKTLLEQLQRDSKSVSVAAPRITLFDGQAATILLASGKQSSPPDTDSDPGVHIKITAAISDDYHSVALTVNSTIKSNAVDKVSPAPPPETLVPTIFVPDKGTVLQIGQTVESSGGAEATKKRFIVLVRPKIVDPKDIEKYMFGPATPAR